MTSLKESIAGIASRTDAVLDQLLEKSDGLDAPVFEAARYSSLMGGKRLRPYLVMQSCALFNIDEDQALRVAAALEMVHTYSLIHDDLPAMDDSDFRRGHPSCHKAFDDATAVLAGDALLTYAFEVLSDIKTHRDANIRCDLVRELAIASGFQGMVGGQMMDLVGENQELTYEQIRTVQDKKTGALFRFALIAGALMDQAPAEDRQALSDYAAAFGLIFQITDDLLDIEGDADEMGKPVGQDPDKVTFVTLLGIDGAKDELKSLENKALSAIERFEGRAEYLRLLLQYVISRKN